MKNGKFANTSTEQYINNRESILIKKDGKYAGFFLVSKKHDIDVIEEFGIMPKYRSGFFTYNVIKEYFLRGDKTTKFMILKEKKEWLNCIEYMLNKNNDRCKIVEKKEEIFHHSKDIKYKFTSFLVEHV